ncbi:unnamed protein product, partial [Ectocarpus sp. 12 AP-2014]
HSTNRSDLYPESRNRCSHLPHFGEKTKKHVLVGVPLRFREGRKLFFCPCSFHDGFMSDREQCQKGLGRRAAVMPLRKLARPARLQARPVAAFRPLFVHACALCLRLQSPAFFFSGRNHKAGRQQ